MGYFNNQKIICSITPSSKKNEYDYLIESARELIMQNGGSVVSFTGYDPDLQSQTDSLINVYSNLNFVQRAKNYKQSPSLKTNTLKGYEEEPSYNRSTHLMAYDFDSKKGEGRVFPTIVQYPNSNKLHYFENMDDAYNYADSTKQYIPVNSEALGEYMSNKGYKISTGIPIEQEGGQLNQVDLMSKFGYRNDSPYKNRAFNLINSNIISMQNVDKELIGISDIGEVKKMKPNEFHKFNGSKVLEVSL